MENNQKEPDLAGYEIKAHRTESSSYVTLFTKSPSFPKRGANAYLKNKFGIPYENNPRLNKLHTSMFGNSFNIFAGVCYFKLINDRVAQRIYIGVYTLEHILIDDSVYYTYADIRRTLNTKLKDLFYVEADRKYDGNDEWFRFTSAEIYSNPSFDKFLEMIDNNEIMFDIRIGSYQSGKMYGKPHDHGSGFRIKEYNLHKLYSTRKKVQ